MITVIAVVAPKPYCYLAASLAAIGAMIVRRG
jgi:hypothetical protein